MAGYEIVEVRTRRHERTFLDVPRRIYADDPAWIPHLEQDIRKIFDPRKNKAFRHGQITRWILVDGEGRPAGRVAAFVDERTAYKAGQPTGGMGFFECVDDHEAASMLFDACRRWLERRGMEAMDGPINFGEKIAFWGLLVENFDDPPTYQVNYNPPYYRDLFEQYGFRVYYYQYIFRRPFKGPAPAVFIEKSEQLRADPGFRIRTLRQLSDERFARDFQEVYNDAFGHRDGFKPLTFQQAMKILRQLKPVSDPDIIMVCYYHERPVAFYVNIPELNEIFRYVDGDLNWVGKLKFLWHKWRRTARTINGIVFGVANDFQGRGVEGAMIQWAAIDVAPLNRYDDTILTWIADFNPKMIKVCENLEAYRWRTLATFRKLFDEDAPFERAPIEQTD
jgi:hypothetical protein